jgi:glycosyltransferase involved in cell wall biosynthesis
MAFGHSANNLIRALQMRILQVVSAYLPAFRRGGPLRSVHGLSCALAQLGHEVEVYTSSMDGVQNLDVPLEQPVILDGVKIAYFSVPWMRRLAWAPALSRRLRETIHGFDVVHLHSVFLWPTARAAKKPYFYHPAVCWWTILSGVRVAG